MINHDLVDYIQKAKAAGRRDAEITQSLIQLGWKQEDVADSLKKASPSILVRIRKNWKLAVVYLVIVVLVIVLVSLAYLAFTTPIQN